MKILKVGTKIITVIGDIEAIITGVYIAMDYIEYKIRWFYNGEERHAWVFRYEIEVAKPKQNAGFNRSETLPIQENEITLITS